MRLGLIYSSGSEIRIFIHSGLLSVLIEQKHEVVILYERMPIAVRELILKNCPKVVLRNISFTSEKRRTQNVISSFLDHLWVERQSHVWVYKDSEKNIISTASKLIKRVGFIENLMLKVESALITRFKNTNFFAEVKSFNIDKFLVTSSHYHMAPDILSAGVKLHIPIHLIYHSYKELFAEGRHRIRFDKVGVWSDEMRRDFLQRHESQVNVFAIGSVQFLPFISKIDVGHRSILYISAGKAVRNEYLVILKLHEMCKAFPSHDFIVRINPMDLESDLIPILNENGIKYQVPKWLHDKGTGQNLQLTDDLQNYRELLSSCTVCISIPSTISVECALMEVPIINIIDDLVDFSTTSNTFSISDYWNSAFYRHFKEKKFVFGCKSYQEIEERLNVVVSHNMQYNFRIEEYLSDVGESLTTTVDFIVK